MRSAPPTSNDTKPLASISLDLDNQWSYMEIHGDSGWEKFPSYFEIFIPKVLDILDRFNLKITFFVVGQDAALDKNREMLSLLTARGHEVGNHSFSHEPWFHLYPKEHIRQEILKTEEHIVRVTGQKPIGFRGPGYSWSSELFEVLIENGYVYDASTLPTYIGPIARMYYFRTSNFTREEKDRRNRLFGSFRDGLRPVKPFCWNLDSGADAKLLEIPITTIPILKTPFHLSYLLYLSRFSLNLMSLYLTTALNLCRLTGTTPSYLLHPLDFLGGDQIPELAFFPGMDLSGKQKMEIFERVLKELEKHFTFGNMSLYAKSISSSGNTDSSDTHQSS